MTSVFLEQRVESLATVLLTRHPSVIVAPAQGDSGYDLEVNVARHGQLSGRVLGVLLKARTSVTAIGRMVDGNRMRLRANLRQSLHEASHRMRELPFPLLFMVFDMESDRAFSGWLRQPTALDSRLASPRVEYAAEWTKTSHVEVIAEVERWYENHQRRGLV